MSRTDALLIGTEDSFDEVVGLISRALGVEAHDRGQGSVRDVAWLLGEGGLVSLQNVHVGSFEDDPAYDGIVYEASLFDAAGDEQMTATSRHVYTAIAAGTPWKVGLILDDDVVEVRDALEAA